MIDFLSRRLAAALVTLVLATIVVFAVVEVLPGDPALVMLGTDARPDTLAALRAKYGFNQPLPVRYWTWIAGLFTFDLGNSHAYGTSVAKLIGDRLVVTLPLGAMALSWATLVAIPLGVFAAWKHRRPGDWGVMGFTQIGISVASLGLGMYGEQVLAHWIEEWLAPYDVDRWIAAVSLVCLVALGNVLGKVKPNFYVGVRTPWTIASEAVWIGTHRMAAWAFVAGSAVGLLGGLVGTAAGVVLTVAVSAARDWTPVLDLRLAAGAPLLGAVVGLAAGTYPAWRASAVHPIDALRSAG